MFTIYITLKSFESYYIEKNAAFLKNLLLLSKSNTVNIKEIDVKEILGLQTPEKSNLTAQTKPESLLVKKLSSDSLRADSQVFCSLSDKKQKTGKEKRKNLAQEKDSVSLCIHEPNFSEISSRKRCYIPEKKDFSEINLPIKQKLFTVLRSVHVHKKSRLQFHFTHYIKKLTFQAENVKMMFLILYIVKNAEFYGVELEISFNHKTV